MSWLLLLRHCASGGLGSGKAGAAWYYTCVCDATGLYCVVCLLSVREAAQRQLRDPVI
jgi:hypothetical protein